jgi:Ca-activated chloride channel family protein
MELFANSKVLIYLFITAMVLTGLWRAGVLRKRGIISKLFNAANYQNLVPSELNSKRRMGDILFLTGLFFLFLAWAAPQWGREKVILSANYSQAVVAVDVSESMLAQDIKPSRIASAKMMLSMLVENMLNERLGLIAFTSQAYVQAPITTDAAALKNLAGGLHTGMLPVPGTALAPAAVLGAKMLEAYPGRKALVLITDGEDHNPQDIDSAIKAARDNNIKIITVGIGSKEGELIPVKTKDGGKSYKTDKEGKTVVTKLDEQTLISFAQATGGVYINYTTPQQVSDEIAKQLSALDKTSAQSNQRVAYKNRYQLPLCIGILFILGSILVPMRNVKYK